MYALEKPRVYQSLKRFLEKRSFAFMASSFVSKSLILLVKIICFPRFLNFLFKVFKYFHCFFSSRIRFKDVFHVYLITEFAESSNNITYITIWISNRIYSGFRRCQRIWPAFSDKSNYLL